MGTISSGSGKGSPTRCLEACAEDDAEAQAEAEAEYEPEYEYDPEPESDADTDRASERARTAMSFLRPRKAAPDDPLIVSMSGVRSGQQLLAIVGHDHRLFFDLAARVGLTGRAFGVTAGSAEAAALGEEAIRHGVAADTAARDASWGVAGETIDVAVIDGRDLTAAATIALLAPVKTAVRPGGRTIVVLAAAGGAVARLLGRETAPDVAWLLEGLRHAGFGAGRLVAVRDGLAFVEAARPST